MVLLDLHWAAPDSTLADKQLAMPDHSHAADFWRGVATAYKDNPQVAFELFNEPFPGLGNTNDAAWACWATGACSGVANVTFKAAGMTELMSAVRSTGATNVILLGALVWSNHLDGWLGHVPADPLKNTAAVWHSYPWNACVHESCWESTVAKVAEQFPVVVTESGGYGKLGGGGFDIAYATKLWSWLESKGISYMAWAWNIWGGQVGNEDLITDYDGTPSDPWGKAWKAQLAAASAPTPAPEPTPAPAPTPVPPPAPACADVPPGNNATRTCAWYAGFGKCSQAFMVGYCCRTCFQCAAGCGKP